MVQAAAIARSLSASADIFEIFRNLPGLAANRLPLTGFVFMFPPVHDLAQRDITCGGVRQIGERITYYPVRGIPESVHLLRVVGNRDPPLALFGHPIPNEAIWVMPNIGFLADELTVPTMDFLGGAIDYAYTRTGYNARMSWKNGIGAVFRIVAPAYVVQLFMLHVKRRPQDAPVLLRTLLADCETKIALRQDHYYGTPDRNDRVLYGTRDALEPLFNGNPGALYTPLQPSELASIEQAIRAGSVVLLSPRP